MVVSNELSNERGNNKTFEDIVKTKICNININGEIRTISNTNELLGNLNGVYGVKTGFTKAAGRILVWFFFLPYGNRT